MKRDRWRGLVLHIPSDAEIKEDEHTAKVRFAGIELRFQNADDHGWELDEIVGRVALHLEQMSDSCYWMGLRSLEDTDVMVHINVGSVSCRARVQATGWIDG